MAAVATIEGQKQNARILTCMKQAGIGSVAELCRRMRSDGMLAQENAMGEFINMKAPARCLAEGRWTRLAADLAEFFGCLPEDLFPDDIHQWGPNIPRWVTESRAKFRVNEQLSEDRTPDEAVEMLFFAKEVKKALGMLDEKYAFVLKMRHGLTEEGEFLTVEEIAKRMNCSRAYVCQVEERALSKLRQILRCNGTLDVPKPRTDILGNIFPG